MKYLLLTIFVIGSLPLEAQTNYPPAKRINIRPAQIFDITQARKKPQNLFDGDITTPAFTDYFNEYILSETKGQVIWIVLDSFINHPKMEVYNNRYGSGPAVEFQFFYDWTDTSRQSPVYSVNLPEGRWEWVDSNLTRQYKDSARLMKIRITSNGSYNFTEVRLYANKLGPATPIYPQSKATAPDEGKYFMGYGKLFVDTLMDDAGYSQRAQTGMDFIDTARTSNGKTIVFNKYSNSVAVGYMPTKRSGRKIYPYFAGPREAFKYPPHYNSDSKDIPIGADSTDIKSWQAAANTYYGLVAKLGHNKKASIEDYRFRNTEPGVGLGMIDEIEIGNEDDARWAGPLRFHNPLVKLTKLKAGYAAAKAADPKIKVVSGALTGIDTSYLRAMYLVNLLRFKTKEMPFDVIAINEYATNAGGQHAASSADGITPEEFKLYERLKGAIEVRNRYYPGMPVYLTEFGYDVHDGSNYDVPVVRGQSREQTKAYWTIRSMEIAAAARISKYYQYTQKSIGGGDFGTTGFTYDTLLKTPGKQMPAHLHQVMEKHILDNGGWTTLPRDLYWYMVLRAKLLADYKAWPAIIQRGGTTGAWILKYAHKSDANKFVYAVWLGSGKNNSVKNFQLKTGAIREASIVRAVVGKKEGEKIAAEKTGDAVRIPVIDESVTYIVVQVK